MRRSAPGRTRSRSIPTGAGAECTTTSHARASVMASAASLRTSAPPAPVRNDGQREQLESRRAHGHDGDQGLTVVGRKNLPQIQRKRDRQDARGHQKRREIAGAHFEKVCGGPRARRTSPPDGTACTARAARAAVRWRPHAPAVSNSRTTSGCCTRPRSSVTTRSARPGAMTQNIPAMRPTASGETEVRRGAAGKRHRAEHEHHALGAGFGPVE